MTQSYVRMAEAALLVVSPAHRGRGLMEAFSGAIQARAGEMGLLGSPSTR